MTFHACDDCKIAMPATRDEETNDCPRCGRPTREALPSEVRPAVTILTGPIDRPRSWRIDWPDGTADLVMRSTTPLRLKVRRILADEDDAHRSGAVTTGWVEVPNDGRLPCPDITDTSD